MDARNIEEKVRDAILAELQRQLGDANVTRGQTAGEEGFVTVNGRIDLEAVAMAVAGALAGGP